MSLVDEFFREIDRRWPAATANVRLSIIGSGALMLQARYERGTKDSDVFETSDLSRDTRVTLLRLAGAGSELHQRWKLYVDIVGSGVPFLPTGARWRPVNAGLVNLELRALDVVDVVVSKLKRYSANDQADIAAMIERDLVPHDALVARFLAAVDAFSGDARAEELPKYVANLHRVERDLLDVDETEVELPKWI